MEAFLLFSKLKANLVVLLDSDSLIISYSYKLSTSYPHSKLPLTSFCCPWAL